jgi:hypothetical protein
MPTEHTVRQGECIASIAQRYGHFPDAIWDHVDNAELKKTRQDPFCLLPGDRVIVPDKAAKDIDCAAGERHRFRRKGVPEQLKVQFLLKGEPRANEAYSLNLDGELISGTTDADGWLTCAIPPGAKDAKVTFGGGKEVYDLDLGRLDPIEETTGALARLRNLGFYTGPLDGDPDDLEVALVDFQAARGLEITGELDDATKAELEAVYGG